MPPKIKVVAVNRAALSKWNFVIAMPNILQFKTGSLSQKFSIFRLGVRDGVPGEE